jgi:hypothetical protein
MSARTDEWRTMVEGGNLEDLITVAWEAIEAVEECEARE